MEIRDGQGFNLLLTLSGDTIREGAGYQILATIDGVYIHDRQNRIVRNVADNYIREGAGVKILYTIRGDQIFEASESTILFVMKGTDLLDPSGFKPVLTATERLTPVQIAAVLYALEQIGFTVTNATRE
jgi:hypothetical protein